MENPIIQTDIAQVLNKLDSKIDRLDQKLDEKFDRLDQKFDEKFDRLDQRLNKLETGQVEIKEKLSGEIKALDTKTEQLNIRVGNVEFAIRGVLVGLIIVILGGFAMFFWMVSKL